MSDISQATANVAPPAAMDTFIRLKVILSAVERGPGQQKMMAVAGTTPWTAFRSAAALKFGYKSDGGAGEVPSVKFLWEGCCIEEPDDKCIGSFLKDGDMLVMVATDDLGSQPGTDTELPPKDDMAETDERNAGPMTRDASTSGEVNNGRPRRSHAPNGRATAATAAGPANQYVPHHPSKALLSIRDMPYAEHSEQDPRDAQRMPSDKARPSMQSLPPLPSTRPASQGDPSLIRQGSGGDQDKKCTCKHSRCVKLYCICWSAGVLCNSCLCQDCFNKPENEEFIKAEQSRIRSRNPLAFSVKVEQGRDGEVSHKIGCRCRRSQCIKKYCECFDGGVKCSPNCRCMDCYNKPDAAEGEDGLASLASAAQMAAGCLTEEPFQLTPGTAAAVAPYHLMSKSLAHGMPDAGAADMSMWPGTKQGQRARQASDGEDGGEQPAAGKKRRSSSNSSTGVLAAAARAAAAAVGQPGGGSGGGSAFAPPTLMIEDKPASKFSSRIQEVPQVERQPVSHAWHDSMAWAGPGSGSAGDAGAPAANSSQAASDGSYESEGAVRDSNAHSAPPAAAAPTRPTALPRPTGRHPERPWSGPAPPAMKGSGTMQGGGGSGGGGSILHHLQQQQQQMEAYMLHQQQAAAMMAVAGADMGVMYPGMPLSRGGYSYLMYPPSGPGGMMMMPMLNTAGSMSSMGLPSPHAMIEEEPMGTAQG